VAHGENDGPLADWLSLFGISWPGRRPAPWTPGPSKRVEQVHTSRVLRRLVEVLRLVEHPSLLDLGPLSGSNVNFFGSVLGGRLVVNDIYSVLDAAARRAAPGGLGPVIERAMTEPGDSLDGVLCWDLFDYLDADEAAALAREVARVLKPGGAALAMFATVPYDGGEFTRFTIEDLDHIRYRPQAASLSQQRVQLGREVVQIVRPLLADETYLLAHGEREALLRKPRVSA
jgi:SAM-dependent methyltransferase